MKKNTTIVLKKNLINLGQAGDLVKVNLGYARNYLIPNSIAEMATPGRIKHFLMLQRIKKKNFDVVTMQIETTKQNLNRLAKITVKKKTGVNNQIFGRVSDKEVLLAILNLTNEKLNKNNLIMPEIKYSGIYGIDINLSENIVVKLKLQVIPLDF